jgi:hypothetical protein
MFNEVEASEQEDAKPTKKRKHKVSGKGKAKKSRKKKHGKKHASKKKIAAKK